MPRRNNGQSIYQSIILDRATQPAGLGWSTDIPMQTRELWIGLPISNSRCPWQGRWSTTNRRIELSRAHSIGTSSSLGQGFEVARHVRSGG